MHINLSKITFPDKLSVTEQAIDISALNDHQKQFYIELLQQLIDLYNTKGRPRLIIGISGPSGSGKSVISMLFTDLAKQVVLPFALKAISIDAFHYPNSILTTTFTDKVSTLKQHKGKFDTYDTGKLVNKLSQFCRGAHVSFPLYSRVTHDPVENMITTDNTNTLLIVEGLWLTYKSAGWEHVDELIDYTIFVTADKERTKELVTNRHIKGGRTPADALNFFNAVDSVNFDMVMDTKDNADMIIPPFYQI